jgi:putative Mg2+ transporter-C (MgtC) family protein
MLLGAILGLEREFAKKPAGLRTNMLVAGASAFLVELSQLLTDQFDDMFGGSAIRSDPIRVIEAVITGVSFLGAGTIIRRHASRDVEGLTTAASLLFAAAVGICVALSEPMLAALVALTVAAALRVLGWLETWALARFEDKHS